MRVAGPIGPEVRSAQGGMSRAGPAAGFSLAASASTPQLPPAGGPPAAAALLTLQDISMPIAGGRRRAVARGQALLDRLDELRLGLLDGAVPLATLERLRVELGNHIGGEGDPRLADALLAVEVRCAVELAKLGLADAQA